MPILDKKDMPSGLKRLKDCPDKLRFRGKWRSELFANSLAIVGSRKMTRYGQSVIASLMPDLVAAKVTIISGFMYGVDLTAHKMCLELGGKTVAVLGWGLDYQWDKLSQQIIDSGGILISEYDDDFKPTLWSFPQRNRIVAAFASLGVLVVEAGEKSGSLITARLGRQQGKKVWAIPGPVDSPTSAGTNWLIKEGLAQMARNAGDILNKKITATQSSLFDQIKDEVERKIMELVGQEPVTIDEIVRQLKLTPAQAISKITILCVKNLVEEDDGTIYKKNGESVW